MGDRLHAANDRCTCMEVYGEDQNCSLHGIATEWALENTLPSEWQNNALEAADELTALRERLGAADKALYDGLVKASGACGLRISRLTDAITAARAILSHPQQGGEDV